MESIIAVVASLEPRRLFFIQLTPDVNTFFFRPFTNVVSSSDLIDEELYDLLVVPLLFVVLT